MNALDLLLTLEARGVVLTSDGARLIVDSPKGALTATDLDALRRLKPALLAILEVRLTAADLSAEWYEVWDERAAIMEYDGGLPRERADAMALADVLQAMVRAGIPLHSHA
jgi:hypothetical protein